MDSTDNTIRTIADIARLAGVSKSTVSRALNDSPLISEETKTRIRDIAQASNYELHRGARNLSLKRSQTIAAVISINPEIGHFITDPFYLELLGAIANTLSEYDYDLLIAQTKANDRRGLDRYLGSKRADGLILITCTLYSYEVSTLVDKQAPFIVWGEGSPDRTYCSVRSDDVQGGRLAVQHLIQLGRKRIAFLGGTEGAEEVRLRYQGYETALREAGQPVDPGLVTYGDYTSQSGYSAMKTLLERTPDLDAVFVNSDVMAIAAMEALREFGRHVPQDVAVVGYDGIPLAAHCSPPLTTVQQDIAEAGQRLVQNLMQYIEDRVVTTTILPVKLIVRESSGALP